MRFVGWLALVAGFVLSVTGPVLANALDTVSIAVEDRSEAAQQQALKEGLDQVLVRLAGKKAVLDMPVAPAAAEQLDRWVTRYDYQGDDLVARYDVQGLMEFMAGQGAPVWGLPRPRLLVWLVDQGAGKGEMVNADHPLYAPVQEEAARRGLNLTFPQWDATDRRALTVADVRGRFDSQLLEASRRYPHEMIVSAVLYRGGDASVSWRVLQDQKNLEQGREQSGDASQAVTALVDAVADSLADRFAVTGAVTEQRTLLVVNQVASLADWKALRDYLSGLSGMRRVSLVQVSGDSVTYGLDFAASDEQLRSLLGLSGQLRACPEANVPGPQWRYCWRG